MSTSYADFIRKKSQCGHDFGFAPDSLPDFLFDFQRDLVEWALKKGRAAIFADCGLGKTPMQLAWADQIVRRTNGRVLVVTPLAVGAQTIREGEKFGIECHRSREGELPGRIMVTNYERLHHFDPSDFDGVVCDESSAIKAFDGKRRAQVTQFLSNVKFRLLCTATAAPNDYIELGTSSEALGVLGQIEMLSQFFQNSEKTVHQFRHDGDFWIRHKWFFKPHAETAFWRWVCSWARAVRRPSDLGFDDTRFVLPSLNTTEHIVKCDNPFNGELFPRIATTLKEQREERRATMTERCEYVARLVNHKEPAVVWCQYNEEGDLLENLIPDCVQVSGADSDDEKEERLTAFSRGDVRVIVTKPKIGAWGLNWQHCGHHTFFPSHSFEQFYQATRRSLRFGRVGPVNVDIVATEGEAGVTSNLKKKQVQADDMFAALVREMNSQGSIQKADLHKKEMRTPQWL